MSKDLFEKYCEENILTPEECAIREAEEAEYYAMINGDIPEEKSQEKASNEPKKQFSERSYHEQQIIDNMYRIFNITS